MEGAASTILELSGVVTTDMISGVFGQIMGLVPIVLPAVVAFVGFRKGLSWLLGVLHSA